MEKYKTPRESRACLQWGRDRWVAEISLKEATRTSPNQLQWGRGCVRGCGDIHHSHLAIFHAWAAKARSRGLWSFEAAAGSVCLPGRIIATEDIGNIWWRWKRLQRHFYACACCCYCFCGCLAKFDIHRHFYTTEITVLQPLHTSPNQNLTELSNCGIVGSSHGLNAVERRRWLGKRRI